MGSKTSSIATLIEMSYVKLAMAYQLDAAIWVRALALRVRVRPGQTSPHAFEHESSGRDTNDLGY